MSTAAPGSLGFRLNFLLVIFLSAATSPSSGWLAPINSNINSRRASLQTSSQLQSTKDENEESALRIGKRVGSGAYGTVHIAHSLDNDSEKRCIVKRAWTLSEIEMNVPTAVMQLDSTRDVQRTGVARATGVAQQDNHDENSTSGGDKMKERAERCRYYWNVERHIVQKLANEASSSNSHVTPQFKGVFRSDGDTNEGGEIVPGYGKIGTADNNNNSNEGGGFFSMMNGGDDNEGIHEWMVFEYIPSSLEGGDEESLPSLTLLDAMEVSIHTHSRFLS